MDPQVPASFIPKKPLDGSGARSSSHGIFGGLLIFIAVVIFILSLVGAGAAFAYQSFLTQSIAQKTASLQAAQDAFDPSTIQNLIRINSRINNAQTLLGEHVAPSNIFSFLALNTLAQVSFTNFSYLLGDDYSAAITLTGTADSFSTVALQSDQFGASKVLKDVVFSDITVDQTGKVSFTVTATVDPSLINYAQNVGNTPMQPATTTLQTIPTTAPSTTPQTTQ